MAIAKISREEIARRLHSTVDKGKPIIGVGCSCGLFAKCAELGGVDLIIVYSTGISRLKGLPTWIIGDSNEITLRMIEEISHVVKHTPIIAGVEGCDPTREMDKYIEEIIAVGASGIINFPTLALGERNEYWRKSKEDVGWGLDREVAMIRSAHEMGLFTLCYVRFNGDAVEMVHAGADMVCVHGGRTAGGLVGRKNAPSLKENVRQVNAMARVVHEVNPKVFIVQHGGSVATPDDTTYIYQNSKAVGYIGASSFERIPIEQALIQIAQDYKSKKLP